VTLPPAPVDVLARNGTALRVVALPGGESDLAVEAQARKDDLPAAVVLLERPVPAVDDPAAVGVVGLEQERVHGAPQRDLELREPAPLLDLGGVDLIERPGVLVEPVALAVASLEAGGEVGRGVGRVLAAEQIVRRGRPLVD